jgi:hypothetical protein
LTVVLKLPGRGSYSTVTVQYTQRLQPGQPTPLQVKRGDPWSMNGVVYRVVEVRA